MNTLKKSFFFFFCLFITVNALAQTDAINITGSITQNKYAEIAVLSNTGGSKRIIATYITDPDNSTFSLAIPYRTNAVYQLKITIMKMGHVRLESDHVTTFPLQLAAKQNIHITLNPAQFDEKTLKGITIEQQASKFSTATVNGNFTNWALGGELSLERVTGGSLKKIETYNIEKGSPSFSFIIPVQEEGFYYLSNSRWNRRIYLKPQSHIELNVDGATGVQIEWLKSNEENQVLSKWVQLISPATSYGYNLEQRSKAIIDSVAFYAAYQSLQSKVQSFLKSVHTANPKFNSLFKTAVQLDNSLLALRSVLHQSGRKHLFWLPAKEYSNVPAFYKQMVAQNKINSTDLLQFGEGNEYLNLYAKFSLSGLDAQKRKQLDDAEKLKLMLNAIPNETLKSYILESQLEELNVNNYSEFRAVFLPYKKYATPVSVKRKFDKILEQFTPDTVFIGKSAYDFILPDVNGKLVSMKDFKGKVVLIDVWATWCGPCKAQIPFLKEVEESYKGNNDIVFVGVSLDTEQNKQKWLDMVKEKGLEGVQLLDNSGKSFGRKYKLTAIPRFLLIDKKGNWVEVRCPLPENQDRLKAYIDRELKKGG